MLDVFRRHYARLVRVIASDSASVAVKLFSMGLLNTSSFERISSDSKRSERAMREIEEMFRFNPSPPYELMVQFCEVISEVKFRDHHLPEDIMRTLGELVNVTLHNF